MRSLQRLCVVGVFSLVLTTTTFAGDIHTGIASPAPPDQSSVIEPGHIQSPQAIENPQGTSESVADIALSLMQTMLSVF